MTDIQCKDICFRLSLIFWALCALVGVLFGMAHLLLLK